MIQTICMEEVLKYPHTRKQTLSREILNGKVVYTLTSIYTTATGLKVPIHKEISEQEFKERQKYNGGVLEIDNDDIINAVTTKPTPTSLKQLREIKQRRFKEKIRPLEIPLNPLSDSIRKLTKLRGIKRKSAFKELAFKLMEWLKNAGYSVISLNQITAIFDNLNLSLRSIERLRSTLIKTLKENNLISKGIPHKKTYYSWRIKPLFSYDGGAYSVMIKKASRIKLNGELVGCIADSNASIIKEPFQREIKTFTLN